MSLPLKAARSAVFWPRRTPTARTLDEPLATYARCEEDERVCALATAIACVLHRYGSGALAIGIQTSGDRPRILALSLLDTDSLLSVGDAVENALRGDRLAPSTLAADTAYNPHFPILLAADGHIDALPELRQDLNLAIDPGTATLRCSYGSRLFDPQTVDAFLGHICSFLAARMSDPSQTVAAVRYVSPHEIARIDAAGRPAAATPLPMATVQALFAQAVADNPNADAIEADGTSLTYRELDVLSGRMAAGLAAAGVVPKDRVVLAMRPGIRQIAGLLGILKAGATAVPIDYTFPAARIKNILAIAQPRTIFTDGVLSAASVSPLSHLTVEAILERASVPCAPVGGELEDPVYVLFTSGSTGTPKGVTMPQRTLSNLVQWQQAASQGCGARTLNRSSVAFDVGFQEIFSSLCFGHMLVVASEAQRADVVGLAQLISKRRVDRIFVPPISLIQMAEAFDEHATPLTTLRHVVVSGEAMRITPAIIRMFRSCAARVSNQYGPTETHVATSYDLEGPSLRWPQLPQIGRPIANARVHILDSAGQRCPIGVRGEIAIGGLIPALGYLGDPAQTEMRFVPDPYADATGSPAGMYLTGDLGRITADGNFEFLGRRDDQIKLRGYRIELGDIEANAMTCEGVKIAAAVLRNREPAGPYIALFVELKAGAALEIRRIRDHVASRLPEHMVPGLGAITILARLPLNRNGKIDRKQLPEIAAQSTAPDEGQNATIGTQIERIWRQYLNAGEIRADDEFIALGGHSLVAIQIISRINDHFGVSVPVGALLQGGTLARFADTVRGHMDARSKFTKARSSQADQQDAGPLHKVTLADGRTILAPYPEEAHHYHREVVERDVYLRHGIALDPAAVVLDVGANIGLFALSILSRYPGCRIIAVEPSPLSAAALRHNLDGFATVTLLEIGLSDLDGEREYTFYPNVTGMSSFVPDAAADRALLARLVTNIRTDRSDIDRAFAGNEADYLDARLISQKSSRPVRRLSSVISELGLRRIDLLKIDVQRGSEHVLDGIDPPDWAMIRQIVIEHQLPGADGPSIDDRLVRVGYRVETRQDDIHRGTNVVYTYATRLQ